MSLGSAASVPMANGGGFLPQLYKHRSPDRHVGIDADCGMVVFPHNARSADWPGNAIVSMTTWQRAIDCRIDASAPERLAGSKGAPARHLDRFAFREVALDFDWKDA